MKSGSKASSVVTTRNPCCLKSTRIQLNHRMIVLGTWNVRTLAQAGKSKNVQSEMNRLGINILDVSETRWPGSGQTTVDDYKFIYSEGDSGYHIKGLGIMMAKFVSKCLLGYWPIFWIS